MAKPDHTAPETKRIYELEDELKIAKRRVDELRAERDEANATVARLTEHFEEFNEIIESWRTTFGMVMIDGRWVWEESHTIAAYNKLVEDYADLVRRYRKLWQTIAPGEVGRPLAASEAQVAQVLKLRNEVTPLRLIVDETGLGLQTVRTIIDREKRTDRTTVKRKRKHMPDTMDKFALASHKARKRTFDALPKQVAKHLEAGTELMKAVKRLAKRSV
jgi:chromosome segregation ATPase